MQRDRFIKASMQSSWRRIVKRRTKPKQKIFKKKDESRQVISPNEARKHNGGEFLYSQTPSFMLEGDI